MKDRLWTSSSLRRLTARRSAALAGVLFAVLFTLSVTLLRSSLPVDPFAGSGWLEAHSGRIRAALLTMPFAGIFFLWFIGVVRDRPGALEDRFFASVCFGSALVFLAMVFVSTATVELLSRGQTLTARSTATTWSGSAGR